MSKRSSHSSSGHPPCCLLCLNLYLLRLHHTSNQRIETTSKGSWATCSKRPDHRGSSRVKSSRVKYLMKGFGEIRSKANAKQAGHTVRKYPVRSPMLCRTQLVVRGQELVQASIIDIQGSHMRPSPSRADICPHQPTSPACHALRYASLHFRTISLAKLQEIIAHQAAHGHEVCQ